MVETGDDNKRRRQAIELLRKARRETVEAASRRMKVQRKAIGAIKEELKGGGKTVPEIAQAVGMPSSEVMWTIATLKKYGEIAEGEKDGNYFRYELTGESDEAQLQTPPGKDEHGPGVS